MAFSGQSFPTLQFGSKFSGIKIESAIPVSVVQNSGYEYRTLRFRYARLNWTIPARALTFGDKETILAFYNQMGGSFRSFLYTDPEHNTLSAYSLGAGTQISAPAAPTRAATTGTLAAGTYTYSVTAYNAQGETIASTAASLVLFATGGVTVSWLAIPGATGYRVYGRSGVLGLIGSTTGLTFTDSGSVTPGAASPSTNTTGTLSYPVTISLAGLAHPLWHIDGLTVSFSGSTFSTSTGIPTLTYPVGSAPTYGSNVTLTGTYSLCARFDMSAAYALPNAVLLQSASMDTIKLIEVFE
jgi:hypothetical protein